MLALRVQTGAVIESLEYGQPVRLGDVRVGLHPAGHVLGSAQVLLECGGERWVVSGDYKVHADPTCAPFRPVRCDTFITEATFALPIYRWPEPEAVWAQIDSWWRENQQRRRTCVLYAYALGKAQRILAGVDASIGPILVHGAVARFESAYRAAGVHLPPTQTASAETARATRGRALVIAPPSAANTSWLTKFKPVSQAFASGWMAIRGARRRRAVDRGFVLSDHADWAQLNGVIEATGAKRIGVTHGSCEVLRRWLAERGYESFVLPTRWEGDEDERSEAAEAPAPS